jgi:hypothetical protein
MNESKTERRKKLYMITVWFGMVYLFIHSVIYVTLDMSVTVSMS